MPSYPRDEMPIAVDAPGPAQVRQVETDDGMTIEITRLEVDVDPHEAFRGLPEDMCQCPDHGYVLSGAMVVRTADGEIVLRAGDAYHIPPGHLPLTRDEPVDIGPTAARDAMDGVGWNLAATGAIS